jgi:hypothetical protein
MQWSSGFAGRRRQGIRCGQWSAEAAKITLIVLQLWLERRPTAIVPAALFAAFVVTVLVWTAAIVIRD